MPKKGPDVLIVGSGFFGCTLAQKFASQNKKVLIIEKRNHIGGNAFSQIDRKTGIEIHLYGSHIFHTNNINIWEYVNQFSPFNSYIHKVLTQTEIGLLPVPINLETINQVFGKEFNSQSARDFIDSIKIRALEGEDNLEAYAKSQVGEKLYEMIIKGYTKKQWNVEPKLLPSSIISRLPVRFDLDKRYFTDKYQGMPILGYEKLFSNMLADKNISVELETDYFDVKHKFTSDQLTIYSGPIDRYFEYSQGVLNWRTLDFEFETIPVREYQTNSVINYASDSLPFTRIHEFKHFYPDRDQSENETVIAREFSRSAGIDEEPFYPVGTAKDKEILTKYKEISSKIQNVYFGGRLGSYLYLDMHMAINKADVLFNHIMKTNWR